MRSRSGEQRVAAGGERGSVTAEFVTVMPAVILMLGCCLGAVGVVGDHVRLTDAAADSARALARGDNEALVRARVSASVDGAVAHVVRRGEYVCANLAVSTGAGPLNVLGLTVRASACSLAGGL
jgi:Flp pilus assembly protein TadG